MCWYCLYSWEQCEVREVFKVTRGQVLSTTLVSPFKTTDMKYPVYSSQTQNNGVMGYYSKYLFKDSITWTTDGANAGTVTFRPGPFFCTNVCGVLLSDKIQADQMMAETLASVAKQYVSYVGNPKLMNNVMAEIEIRFPLKLQERTNISNFLSRLDHLVTLHQYVYLFISDTFSEITFVSLLLVGKVIVFVLIAVFCGVCGIFTAVLIKSVR